MEQTHLRPYQIGMVKKIMDEFETKQSCMCQMPTGTGKTEVFCEIIKQYLEKNRNKKVLILVHRVELLRQIKSRLLKRVNINAGTINSDGLTNYERNVIIGMVASVERRIKKTGQSLDFTNSLLIIDEAHHSNANTYLSIIESALALGKSKLLGVTATPARLDGKKLSDIYDTLLVSPSLRWFIEKKYLSKIRYFGIRHLDLENIQIAKLTGDYDLKSASTVMRSERVLAETFTSYINFAYGKKTLIFCVDVAHAQEVKERFFQNGIDCDIIDSNTSDSRRFDIVNEFKSSQGGVLINVLIFTEGFDCPDIEVVILARPTQSITLYLQMVGRVTRISEGKNCSIILDNAANYKIHGLPTSNYNWVEMFSNPNENTNNEFNNRRKNRNKVKAKIPPTESDNFEMYELIDEDSFSCYESESEKNDYISLSFESETDNENYFKFLPINKESYYLKNYRCRDCNNLVYRFKNILNRIKDFDATLPIFRLHNCNRQEELENIADFKIDSFPISLKQNKNVSIYHYVISKLGHDEISMKKMIYEEIDDDSIEGLNPIIARRVSDLELCLVIFNMKSATSSEVSVYSTKHELDQFFLNNTESNEIPEIENEYDDIEKKISTELTKSESKDDDDQIISSNSIVGKLIENGNAVEIGRQIWMTKNLDVKTFRNGDLILEARSAEEWIEAGRSKTPAWCYFDNDKKNGEKYGLLYNWYAINNKRQLAPEGWLIPTIYNWEQLREMLGGEYFANQKMKMDTEWWNVNRINEGSVYLSGFSALPGGYRLNDGKFLQIGLLANWWSKTDLIYDKQLAKFQSVFSEDIVSFQQKIQQSFKANGYSVRCLKNAL
jgi:uncharacterized protein (TIGR02145 family)